MPTCCGKRFGVSTFHWCCCCCSVPTSKEKLPLLDNTRKIETRYDDTNTINTVYVNPSYLSSKNKQAQKPRIRIVTTSDTHMHHEMMNMPSGDLLIVAGDFTNWKTTNDNQPAFLQWLASLKQYKYKIAIAGNHEVGINENDPIGTAELFQKQANTIYLQDSSFEAFGLKIYGTPWHPKRGCLFHAEAFAKTTQQLKQTFAKIPNDTDILITHVPPYGIRDNETAGHIGSDTLLYASKDRVKPILHCFGHVHGKNGISYAKGSETVFVNTATTVRVFDIIFSEINDVELKVSTQTDEYKIEESEEQ